MSEMLEVLNVKVDKISRLEGEGKIKAFVDLIFGDLFLIRGFRIVEGEKGLFIGMPQVRNTNGKYYNVFTSTTAEVREYLREVILDAYNEGATEKKYSVTFKYVVKVFAESKDGAVENALDKWKEESPTADEMDIEAKQEA